MATKQNETTASSSSHQSSTPHDASTIKQPQVPMFSAFPAYQMFPMMYPALVPGLTPVENQEQVNNGAGIYAVPVSPLMGPVAGLQSNTLIPLTYNIPTTRSSSDAGGAGGHGHGGQQQQANQQQQQPAQQRQVVVRRFQIAFHIDLLLILKLAAVIFLFNQDGSRQRLFVLVVFALVVYLHQTGALTPLVRWLSQNMQRAAGPPHPPRPAARPENIPAPARQNENVGGLAEGQARAENDNQQAAGDRNQAIGEENVAEPGAGNGGNNQLWQIVKEIQMIVFGFITSLLPGFHHID